MHVVRDPQAYAGVPARPVEDQYNLLAGTGPRLAGELRELYFKQADADGRGQMKEGPTRGRMDKADQIAPREAVLHRGHGPLPDRCPDAAQQWFEANTMFVG